MSFIPAQIIKKKRDGHSLTAEEIQFFVSEYYQNRLPDYQMSALLMAIVLKGMSKQEAADLTLTMLRSGKTLVFEKSRFTPVDKHSTGGIGDKTSLLIAPIVAACGVPVPMIAGRGLGHTGGTLDKLESIPGFSVQLDLNTFQSQVKRLGCAIIGQTAEICPADKKMYALRDVTGTVESIPLICGSILSKKIAEGIGGLVMDVKWGSGAFMKTKEQAFELATWLAETAAKSGLKTTAFITNMNQPLGCFIGNTIEVLECLCLLKNETVLGHKPEMFSDTRELSLQLSAEMLVLAGHSENFELGLKAATNALDSGQAFSLFEKMVQEQGGNLKNFSLPKNLQWSSVFAPNNGFISALDGEAIGYAAIQLGAGRKNTNDLLDHSASIIIHKKINSPVRSGEPVFSFACQNTSVYSSVEKLLLNSVSIETQQAAPQKLITQKISATLKPNLNLD